MNHGKETHVCRLKRALYGLKQALCAWYEWIDQYLLSLGFFKNDVDPNLYFKVIDDKVLILVPYVDDLFLTGADNSIVKCQKDLTFEFWDERLWSCALLSKTRNVAKA